MTQSIIDKKPKVFISYSWAKKAETKELAERLRADGVDIILDIWDLKLGHDKYAFMEQCVTDDNIDRVLIICDKSYTEKANNRSGGVGDETMIISPEIYEKVQQEKFIPVVIEVDEDSKPFLPAYLKSRIYIDISDDYYEEGYEQLLRTLYEQPESRKPALGTPPEFLFKEENTSLLPLKEAIRKLKANDFRRVNKNTANDFVNLYLDSLKGFYRKDKFMLDTFLDDFRAMKENRNYFLKFIKLLAESNKIALGDFLAEAFERIYNTLCHLHFFTPQAGSCYDTSFYIFKLHVWELFLFSMTYLLHHDMLSDIHDLLVRTYFLRMSPLSGETLPSSYGAFWFSTRELDASIKKYVPDLSQQLTPIGHIVCIERESLPVYSKSAIADTDLFLFQILDGLELGSTNSSSWYPTCYIYSDIYHSMWEKLISKKFCEKIFCLFDVQSIESLKQKISKCNNKPAIVYGNAINPAPTIRQFIKLQDIGTRA
ncbi:MAG: toll/interleukin-1 receptor domain-containing protein [Synergistaceae bacterium]|nr:toll/interleukin-1 receptor domain-containing protein [Synergistaceae bacterium]MBR0186093.1 toll/interleukin-1 receptor domain-containing protein [Synergistaceae bacterium]